MGWTKTSLGASVGALVIAMSAMNWGWGIPAHSQALFYSPYPDATLLKAQSAQLASDAIRLAQFGRIAEALNRARLAVQLDPTAPELWLILGSLQLESRAFSEAVTTLQEARQRDPQNANILFTLGEALMRNQQYPEAIEVLEAGLAIKNDDPNGFFQLGNAYLLQGDLAAARKQFMAAIALSNTFWPAINNLGLVDYEQGDLTAAMANFEAAMALDETMAEPRLALATVLFIKGRVSEAEQLGIKALQLDPSYGDLETLRINLWGSRLLQDAQVFLQRPRIREALFQARLSRQEQGEGL